MAQRRLVARKPERPLRPQLPAGRGTLDDAFAEAAVPEADVVAAAGREVLRRQRDLRGEGPARAVVEEGEPQRSLRAFARAFVHRVADPDPQRLRRTRRLQVEALVVAGGERHVREASASAWLAHARHTTRP